MNTKKLFAILLTFVFLFGAFSATITAQSDIKVLLNGEELAFDVSPQLVDGRTMVPMRRIFEALGAEINWDEDTQTVTATKGDTVVIMQVNSKIMLLDGKEIELDVAPFLVDDRTLVPARAVAEGLDADVFWDEITRIVTIESKEEAQQTTTPPTTHVPSSRPARDPSRGALYGYGNDGIAELQYNARYGFEQILLPQSVFEEEEYVIDLMLSLDAEFIKEAIFSIWYEAADITVLNEFELLGIEEPEEDEEFFALLDEAIANWGLDSPIISVDIEDLGGDTLAIIINLKSTNWTLISEYIGIAYNENMGLRYFTLERSFNFFDDGDGLFMFCTITPERRSSIAAIENSRQAFINAIRVAMTQ